jgi:peptidyl-dipeptidase A
LIFADKKDYGEMWRESYEDDNFVANVDKMWSQVEPLYKELHTYVRRKLQKMYSKDMDKDSKLIPAHLLGNMWVSFRFVIEFAIGNEI